MADIFLSYARPDLEVSRSVAEDLEAEGFSVFFDQNIGVGESWDALIEAEIEAAKCVVVLWSPISRDREWVRNEARFGRQKGILCPALIAPCTLPLEFNGTQTADLQAHKSGDKQHPEWRRLVSAISKLAIPTASPVGIAKSGEEIGNGPYWRAFAPIADSHGRSRNALKLPKSENYNTPLARPAGFEVYASAFLTRSKSAGFGPYLWIWAKDPLSADALMPTLMQMQSALDAAVGETVRISRVSNHGIWIWLKKSADPDERSEWPKQHAWLAERMAKLAAVYWKHVADKLPVMSGEDQDEQGDTSTLSEDSFAPLLARVKSAGAHDALTELIERLPAIPGISIKFERSGGKHRLAVRRQGERWYSALVQDDWLLWYFRLPVVSRKRVTVDRVSERLPQAEVNGSGEITVRLANREDAIAVAQLVTECG